MKNIPDVFDKIPVNYEKSQQSVIFHYLPECDVNISAIIKSLFS